jgi:hypothetical protein
VPWQIDQSILLTLNFVPANIDFTDFTRRWLGLQMLVSELSDYVIHWPPTDLIYIFASMAEMPIAIKKINQTQELKNGILTLLHQFLGLLSLMQAQITAVVTICLMLQLRHSGEDCQE